MTLDSAADFFIKAARLVQDFKLNDVFVIEAANPANWHIDEKKNPRFLFPQYLLTATQFAGTRSAAILCEDRTHLTYLSPPSAKLLPQVLVGFLLAIQHINGVVHYSAPEPHYLLEQLRLDTLSKILE